MLKITDGSVGIRYYKKMDGKLANDCNDNTKVGKGIKFGKNAT